MADARGAGLIQKVLSIQKRYTGNKTDELILDGAGLIIVVYSIDVFIDDAAGAPIHFRIGFDPTTTPTNDSAAMILSHPGLGPGGHAHRGNGSVPIIESTLSDDIRLTSVKEGGADADYDVFVTYATYS